MSDFSEIFEKAKKAEAEQQEELKRLPTEPTKPKFEDGRLVFEREEYEMVGAACL